MKIKLSDRPAVINNIEYRFDSFESGEVLLNKKKNHLPAMGWNSWNAFGSGNTEALTKAMADKFIELGLDKLGYKYIVLDDGCYKPERVDGLLANEEVKFPSGFKSLAEYIHSKGLKFGMYNDIGTNLCAGALVGTCGHEEDDAKSYIDWGVDFIKVDNCYYLWDNATFSDAKNARYTYGPMIRKILVKKSETVVYEGLSVKDGVITGSGPRIVDDYVMNIGTYDGTGPETSPVGQLSGELEFSVMIPEDSEYQLFVEYSTGERPEVGQWLELAVNDEIIFDGLLEASESEGNFRLSEGFIVNLKYGDNKIRLMNHRRQENTLSSYAELLEGFNKAKPEHDIILSICEWGKTQPQNWGYKVGDSWRILNDITFRVGSDGDPGVGEWESDYTTSVCAQYNKAVIMDEFSGLDKGWNDPDMMMIGMNGLDETMCRSHMTMWAMMNSPLMLGLDLRKVEKGDWIYQIISNKDIISLNQDPLGVQAKRIYSSLEEKEPDKIYIRDNKRVDILVKPLYEGSVAASFFNLSKERKNEIVDLEIKSIDKWIGSKMVSRDLFKNAGEYEVTNLWTKETGVVSNGKISLSGIDACDNFTIKITPKK